jgi:hypothetical protein
MPSLAMMGRYWIVRNLDEGDWLFAAINSDPSVIQLRHWSVRPRRTADLKQAVSQESGHRRSITLSGKAAS